MKKQNIFIALLLLLTMLSFCREDSPEAAIKKSLPKTAKVLADDLKVRLGPNTMSSLVGILQSQTVVRVLHRSAEKFRIASQRFYWYRIRTDDGLTGWVYGAYLDIERDGDKILEKNQQKKLAKLTRMLTGRWYATKQSGSLLPYFLYLASDGYFEFGKRRKVYQHGKYELELQNGKIVIDVLKKKKPMYTEILGTLFGQTFSLKANYRKRRYSFMITDKYGEPFREERKQELKKRKKKKKH